MKKLGLSQEWLKVIACVTMLIDHIGFLFFPYAPAFRYIGRLAFPIYCFLLTEGAHYTRNPLKYALRLGLAALAAELPYDLLFYGRLTLAHQNVIFNLLLAFGMLLCMKLLPRLKKLPAPVTLLLQAALMLIFAWISKKLHLEYGSDGIFLIGIFFLTRSLPYRHVLQALALVALFCLSGTAALTLGPITLPWTAFALLAIIPICLYTGKKSGHSKLVQTVFYLFYPVHLLVLLALTAVLG